jgi:hypothetical protein
MNRYDSVDSFLAIFWLVQETLVDPGGSARIAYESLLDGAGHRLRYRDSACRTLGDREHRWRFRVPRRADRPKVARWVDESRRAARVMRQ